jgi:hypothetical protein
LISQFGLIVVFRINCKCCAHSPSAAKAARDTGCQLITFSGFAATNPLRSLGDLNFHVASSSYGLVEILHLFIIHTVLDMKLQCFDGRDVFDRNKPS